LKNLIP